MYLAMCIFPAALLKTKVSVDILKSLLLWRVLRSYITWLVTSIGCNTKGFPVNGEPLEKDFYKLCQAILSLTSHERYLFVRGSKKFIGYMFLLQKLNAELPIGIMRI